MLLLPVPPSALKDTRRDRRLARGSGSDGGCSWAFCSFAEEEEQEERRPEGFRVVVVVVLVLVDASAASGEPAASAAALPLFLGRRKRISLAPRAWNFDWSRARRREEAGRGATPSSHWTSSPVDSMSSPLLFFLSPRGGTEEKAPPFSVSELRAASIEEQSVDSTKTW